MSFENIITNKSTTLSQSLNTVLKDHINYTIGIVDGSNVDNIIDIYGSNKKKILTIKYEVLGTYDGTFGIFSWACDHVILNKEVCLLSKNVKKYSKTLKKAIVSENNHDHNQTNSNYMEKIYYYLSNSMFFLDPQNLVDIIKISIFVTESKGIVQEIAQNKITTLYFVRDIISY